MKKVLLTTLMLLSLTSVFAQKFYSPEDGESSRGCRRWYIKLFNYTLLEHSSDECGNPDGNWDWGGNGGR